MINQFIMILIRFCCGYPLHALRDDSQRTHAALRFSSVCRRPHDTSPASSLDPPTRVLPHSLHQLTPQPTVSHTAGRVEHHSSPSSLLVNQALVPLHLTIPYPPKKDPPSPGGFACRTKTKAKLFSTISHPRPESARRRTP